MDAPSIPSNENERLQELRLLRLLDTPANHRFDRLTRIAKELFETDIALVSLVDADRQWFKSTQGLNGVSETPRSISVCGHAILNDETFVVEDMAADPRFLDNPLVVGGPKIRMYAGHPLRGPTGQRIGTLCVIHSEPRSMNSHEVDMLQDLAHLAENELLIDHLTLSERALRQSLTEAERKGAIDALTHLWNRDSIFRLLEVERRHAETHERRLGVALADIDHFKSVNDTYGHLAGDKVLAEVAARIRACLRDKDFVGRYGGEEFLIILEASDMEKLEVVAERVRRKVCSTPVQFNGHSLDVTISIGLCAWEITPKCSDDKLIASADRALYKAKESGRNAVHCDFQRKCDSRFP